MNQHVKIQQKTSREINCYSEYDVTTCTVQNVLVPVKEMKVCQRKLRESKSHCIQNEPVMTFCLVYVKLC